MSLYDTWLNVLTGISQGSFDKIYLRDASGNMVDLLTLLGTLGSVTDVISNSSELVVTTNGTTKILTLNLGGYVTSTALTNALAAYTDTTALTTFLGAKQNTLTAGTGIAISGAHILYTHAHHSTTGRYDTEWCNDIKFCRQQCKFCEQCVEHLPHGMAGCLDATIQQLSQ